MLDLKTPIGKNIFEVSRNKISAFDKYIIEFRKNSKSFFDFLYDNDINVQLKSEENGFSFSYFMNLDILLSDERNLNMVNFEFDFSFITEAKKFLFEYSENDLKKKLISIKIIDDLIINFEKLQEWERNDINHNIRQLRSSIYYEYNIIFGKKDLAKEFNLTKEIDSINIKEVYSKVIIELIKEKKFGDFSYCFKLLNTFEVDSNYIDKKIIREIKSILDAPQFISEFLLTKEDYINRNNLDSKINLLYILMIYILNDQTDLENCQFLIKTKKNLDEISNLHEKENLLSGIDKGIKVRYLEVKNIFEKYANFFYKNSETDFQSKKDDNKKKRKKKKKEKEKSKASNTINYYDIEAFKLFEIITLSSNKNSNKIIKKEDLFGKTIDTMENTDSNSQDSNKKEEQPFNHHPSESYQNDYFKDFWLEYYGCSKIEEKNCINNEEAMEELLDLLVDRFDFILDIDYKAILIEDKLIKIIIRKNDRIFSFLLELNDFVKDLIIDIPDLSIY